MKIRLGMTSPRVSAGFLRCDTKFFCFCFCFLFFVLFFFFFFFFLGGGLKLRLVVGRETVQKHVLLFCLTGSRKASTALTLASPSRCRLSMFPRWSRLPPPPPQQINFFIYGFILIFIYFLCCAKSKNKSTSF